MFRTTPIIITVLLVTSCSMHAQGLLAAVDPSTLPDAPSTSLAQQQTSTAPTDPAHPNETDAQRKLRLQREEAAREVQQEEKQRIGGVMPNFNVVLNGQAVPISAAQKLNLAFHTAIDPYTFGLAAVVGGGYGEVSDDHTGYHWGASGYFKRFGAAYADAFNGTMIGNGILPVILKQDPRYYRKIHGSFISRVLYSASTTFVCHGDNGKLQPNISNVLGNFISGAISNVYYPSDESGLELTVENASIQTVEGMVGAQLLEFSPDVTDYIHRRRERHRMMKAQKTSAADGTPAPATTTTPPAPETTKSNPTHDI